MRHRPTELLLLHDALRGLIEMAGSVEARVVVPGAEDGDLHLALAGDGTEQPGPDARLHVAHVEGRPSDWQLVTEEGVVSRHPTDAIGTGWTELEIGPPRDVFRLAWTTDARHHVVLFERPTVEADNDGATSPSS